MGAHAEQTGSPAALHAVLERRLGPGGALVIGLGGMVGTGVLVVAGPAAALAGGLVLPALALAGAVAACNATSAARLASRFPVSGGAYHWGRQLLHPATGSVAGWCFVLGKTASAGAAALALGLYVVAAVPAVPEPAGPWLVRGLAVAAVVACTVANVTGVRRTAAVSWWLVGIVTVVLTGVSLAAVLDADALLPPVSTAPGTIELPSLLGTVAAAGLFFLAFAGYARIATLGEEVRAPQRTIPTAVAGAFLVAAGLYVLVTGAAVLRFGVEPLAATTTVALDLAVAVDPLLGGLVTLAAVAASLAVLLGVLAGVSRVALAMGRTGELPGWLARLHPRWGTPWRADLLAGTVALVVVLAGGVTGAVAVSAATVLSYYGIANAAALRLPGRLGRAVAAAGLAGCAGLVAALAAAAVLAPAAVLGAG